MATPNFFQNLAKGIKKVGAKVVSFARDFNPNIQTGLITVPTRRDHLNDLLTNRQGQSSAQIMESLFRQDPDVSAAVGAYLTLADTPVHFLVKDVNDQIDPNATQQVMQIVRALTTVTDYSQGFTFKRDLRGLCQELRTMLMLRGVIGGELVFDKAQVPNRVQQVDMNDIWWYEKTSGVYKPQQRVAVTGQLIDLDIATFFVAFHRRLPTTIYGESDFVAAINTIAARQQLINDLYRIMHLTGYPRIQIKILEEVMRKNVPASAKNDPVATNNWLSARRDEIAGQFGDLRADQAFVHYDSSEISVFNEKRAGAELNISPIMEALNAQNQAGLKTMATVIGRGTSGINTGTVEARIAAMNADQLNVPLAEFLAQILTFALNLYGVQGFVQVNFEPAELRPNLELEPQRVIKQARLLQDLSLGVISDEEYALMSYGRLPLPGAPPLSGTGFYQTGATGVATDNISPNSDPLGRSVSPSGSKTAKSNGVKNTAGGGVSITLNL